MHTIKTMGIALILAWACFTGFVTAGFAESVYMPAVQGGSAGCKATIDANRKVTISGCISEGTGYPVSIRIMDPKQHVEYAGMTISGQGGEFSLTYVLENKTYGRYQVTVNTLFSGGFYGTSFDYGTDSRLRSLTIEDGIWDTPFDSQITLYNITVPYASNKLRLSATASDPFAEMSLNGKQLGNGSIVDVSSLNVGGNAVDVGVKAMNGSTSLYRLNVIRASADDVQIMGGAKITPEEGLIVSGSMVKGGGQTIAIKVMDPKRRTSYLGSTVTSYDGSFSFKDKSASNTCGQFDILLGSNGSKPLLIKAEYIGLTDLKTSCGNLSPAFDPNVTTYHMSLDDTVDNLRLTPQCFDPTAIINVDGNDLISGQQSKDIAIVGGTNIVNVTVRGHDGMTSKTYTLKINSAKKPSTSGTVNVVFDNKKSLSVSGHIGFEPRQPVNMMVRGPQNEVVYLGTIQTTEGGNYHFTYIMDDWKYGSYNVSVGQVALVEPLYAGFEIKKIKPLLENLVAENTNLTPKFDQEQTNYSATVSYSTSKLSVTPTALDPLATVTVNGKEVSRGSSSDEIGLSIGKNDVEIEVTNFDKEKKTYKIHVTRLPEPTKPTRTPTGQPAQPDLSHVATLKNLMVVGDTLLTPIDDNTVEISVGVDKGADSISMTPVTTSPAATLKLITFANYNLQMPPQPTDAGSTVTDILNGDAIVLDVENIPSNMFYIQVTSPDGQVIRYYSLKLLVH